MLDTIDRPVAAIYRPTLKTRLARYIGRTWARLSYGYRVEPTWLELNRLAVPVAGLPKPFAGVRIAHLTDLHGGHHLPSDYLDEAVDLALAEAPDVIVLTGDFIHKGYRHVDRVAATLRRLEAPLGVFAVLGNHDFSVRNALGIRRHRKLHQAIADALSANGLRVLRNECVRLKRGDASILLAGLDDLWSRECDPHRALGGLCPETPRVVLAHNPQTIHLLESHRCDLMLSGHTHGGQVNWPGLGRFTLGRRSKRFAAGLYRHERSHVYVNKGIGWGSFRFRFNVRPEVALLTLHAEAARTSSAECN
jgi:predicted MPP superfamily phosphohydrolase